MPEYLADTATWKALWPILLASVAIAFLFGSFFGEDGAGRRIGPLIFPMSRGVFVIALAFSGLGMITGYITGLSREPAVNAVMPAVLSLVAGLAVYMIGKNPENREIVGLSIICLATALLVGSLWGAKQRQTIEAYFESEDYLKHRAYVEAAIEMYKQDLEIRAAQYKAALDAYYGNLRSSEAEE